MALLALWIVALLLLWAIGVFVSAIFFPRHRTKIVVSAFILPLAALLLLLSVRGNSSRSGWVFPSEGMTNAQVARCLDEAFSEDNLGRLIRREGLSSTLTPSEVKRRIAITDPVDERDSHHWYVGSGNTWKWKADAYSQLARALSGDLDARLGALRKVH